MDCIMVFHSPVCFKNSFILLWEKILKYVSFSSKLKCIDRFYIPLSHISHNKKVKKSFSHLEIKLKVINKYAMQNYSCISVVATKMKKFLKMCKNWKNCYGKKHKVSNDKNIKQQSVRNFTSKNTIHWEE